MDLRKAGIDTRGAAEAGRKLHVRHPLFNHPLYYGPDTDEDGIKQGEDCQPVTMTVRGYHSKSVQQAAAKVKRKRAKFGDEEEELGLDMIEAMVLDWEGFTDDGEALELTRTNLRLVFDMDVGFFRQVEEFARDRRNFFGKG
jgi:hypothetical protein